MDPVAQKHLEERIVAEVQTMLTEGDQSYLRGLSRAALLEAVDTELRFLGLYTHDDKETPAVIRALLEQHLDQWCEEYLSREDATAGAEWPTPELKVQITASPLIQLPSSAGVGMTLTEVTRYIGFMRPLERPRIQVSPMIA